MNTSDDDYKTRRTRLYILSSVRNDESYWPSMRYRFETALAVADGHLDYDDRTCQLSLTESGKAWLEEEKHLKWACCE